MFRAALHMVISDFFHLRLGASVGVISNRATASRCLYIVFVALGLPPTGGGGGGGGGGGVNRLFQFK